MIRYAFFKKKKEKQKKRENLDINDLGNHINDFKHS